MESVVARNCTESGGLKGLSRTAETICCRPPSPPQEFLIMCRATSCVIANMWPEACAVVADVRAPQSSSHLWWPLAQCGSSVCCPHLCRLPLSHITATLCQHQTTKVGKNPVCLTLYPNTLTLILKALRH